MNVYTLNMQGFLGQNISEEKILQIYPEGRNLKMPENYAREDSCKECKNVNNKKAQNKTPMSKLSASQTKGKDCNR